MKKLFLLICSLTLLQNVKGQNDPKSTDFIREVIIEKDSINYYDHLDKYTLNEIQETLNKDTLFNKSIFIDVKKPHEYLVLTTDEKAIVQKKLGEARTFFWKEGLFDRSKLIATNQDNSNKAVNEKRINYFKKKYSFSKPIFFRSNTICIFYSDYSCGGECGEGYLIVYRKESSRWIRWLTLYGWMS